MWLLFHSQGPMKYCDTWIFHTLQGIQDLGNTEFIHCLRNNTQYNIMNTVTQIAFERRRALVQIVAWSYAVHIHSLTPLLLRDINPRGLNEEDRLHTSMNLGLACVDHGRVRTLARRWSCDADYVDAALFWDSLISMPEFRNLLIIYLRELNTSPFA